MKKVISVLLLGLAPVLAWASSGGGYPLQRAHSDLGDQASLQRGARLFVNYCLSCHSASYMRYNRMAEDLGMTEEMVRKNLMFTTDKIGDTMDIAMSSDDAGIFFGTIPPDLSVVARSRGVDWLYTYLVSFYKDDSRPFGVNNAVFPSVGMPHVLWGLQGEQDAVFEEHENVDGTKTEVLVGLKQVSEGSMTDQEFKMAIRDLVNYLDYMGEPAKLVRGKIGIYVLLFLVILFFVSYAMKKEFWKDVH